MHKSGGGSVPDAVVVVLLHDIGKSMSKQQMLSLCVRNNITIYDFELWENPTALHGKISALLFREEFKGDDSQRIEEISNAISSHVAGDINMKLLDKIIFIADNLDSKKESSELLAQIETSKVDPDYCVEEIIKQKIQRNKEGNEGIDENKKMEMNPLLYVANKGEEER